MKKTEKTLLFPLVSGALEKLQDANPKHFDASSGCPSSQLPKLAAGGSQGPQAKKPHYRAVFVSDTHLGTRAARADLLLDFLKSMTCDKLFLVGDIIDGWQLKSRWYWDTVHNDVIRRVLKMAKHGTEVIYIPGNHDEALRGFEGHNMAGVELAHETIYEALNGKRYWVLHGDKFDGVVKYAKWLAHLGDHAYVMLLRINTAVNWVRHKMGYPYWSLSSYLKHKVKNAVEYIGKYEEAVAHEAERMGVDGVICGHIHHAERRFFGEIEYMNDGDWVESCTALVEGMDGSFEILHWAEEVRARDGGTQGRKKGRGRKKPDAPVPVAAE
ncbi:MAG: UDP-2,3-diacylglucosamine diphosphatase [Alphaproteobacteria bacterium]|nr:UDP-2,3-diacylglucosamine diphosphatase [Alphaproteobacteria bacterium]